MKIFKTLFIILSILAIFYFGSNFFLPNTIKSKHSKHYSSTTGITLTYLNKFGDFKLNVAENNQEIIRFENKKDPSKNILILLNEKGVDRGSVINGVTISVFKTTLYKNKLGEVFEIVSYKAEDESNTYYLEAYNNPQKDQVETIYLKIVSSITQEQMKEAENSIKQIIDGIDINS